MSTIICEIFLPCTYEVHDRKEFQKAGHFVHGRVRTDKVHILTLSMRVGESTTNLQILRVQAESLDDARNQMAEAVRDHLKATSIQQGAHQVDYDSYMKMHQDFGELNTYLRRHYLWEIQHGRHLQFGSPVQTVIHYLHKERSRFWVRFLSIFRRPHEEPDIDPVRVDRHEGA